MPKTADALRPGEIVRLRPKLRRLIAPNPGLMTGPGTNSYLVGDDEVAVIDPGPMIEAHVERLTDLAGAAIRYILTTHTHNDHSPAAVLLARRTGATVIGRAAPAGPHQDRGFAPDRQPEDGEVLTVDGVRLEFLHTPGHASNHVCLFDRASGWLFTGDHIIQGSTVVIDPPDGSMSDYLCALRRLAKLPLQCIAGGHGAPIRDPHAAIDALIRHRLRREEKVYAALGADPATTRQLVMHAYDDVDASLHRLAERSLLAHLIKLEEDGRAVCSGDRWSRAPVGDQPGR